MRHWACVRLAQALEVVAYSSLALAAFLFALLNLGILLIADCTAQCEARGERWIAVALVAGSLVLSGGAVWMARRVLKGARAVE